LPQDCLQSHQFTLQAWLASEGLNIKTIGVFRWRIALQHQISVGAVPRSLLAAVFGKRRGWILIYRQDSRSASA